MFTSSAALDNLNLFEHIPPSLSYQLALSSNRRLASRCPFFRGVSDASLVSVLSNFKALVFVPNQVGCAACHVPRHSGSASWHQPSQIAAEEPAPPRGQGLAPVGASVLCSPDLIPGVLSPRQVIVKEEMLLSSAYFINRGRVQMSQRGEKSHILMNTDNFGLDDLMNSLLANEVAKVRYTATSVTYCDVMFIAIDKVNELLAHDEHFKEHVVKRRSSCEGAALRAVTAASLPARKNLGHRWATKLCMAKTPGGHQMESPVATPVAGAVGLPLVETSIDPCEDSRRDEGSAEVGDVAEGGADDAKPGSLRNGGGAPIRSAIFRAGSRVNSMMNSARPDSRRTENEGQRSGLPSTGAPRSAPAGILRASTPPRDDVGEGPLVV